MPQTKRTRKTTKDRTSSATATAPKEAPVSVGEKSCAYPGCSTRGTKEYGDKKVPGCEVHGAIFETQADDGAGIQQLMENYRA